MDKSDFEELDRAVQSLVGEDDAPQSTSAPKEPVADTAPSSRPPSLTRSSKLGAPHAAASQPSTPKAAPATPVEARPSEDRQGSAIRSRPRGRFMDIVPPRQAKSQPAERVSREGRELSPPTAEVAASPSSVESNEAAQALASQSANLAVPSDELADSLNESPGLVAETSVEPSALNQEVLPQSAADEAAEDSLPVDAGNLKDSSAEDILGDELLSLDELSHSDDKSDSTPFIEGARVEKRPLGGEGLLDFDEESQEPNPELASLEKEPATKDPAAKQPAEPEAPQPDKKKKLAKRPPMTGAQVGAAPVVDEGPASIVQQYKTDDSSASSPRPESSMFDAANYEQPLMDAPKKKSGWLVVLWIILLLGIGGGGAFIAYQLNLI